MSAVALSCDIGRSTICFQRCWSGVLYHLAFVRWFETRNFRQWRYVQARTFNPKWVRVDYCMSEDARLKTETLSMSQKVYAQI